MTRRPTRRKIRDEIDDLPDPRGSDTSEEFVIEYQVVGSDGGVVDTFGRVFSVDR